MEPVVPERVACPSDFHRLCPGPFTPTEARTGSRERSILSIRFGGANWRNLREKVRKGTSLCSLAQKLSRRPY